MHTQHDTAHNAGVILYIYMLCTHAFVDVCVLTCICMHMYTRVVMYYWDMLTRCNYCDTGVLINKYVYVYAVVDAFVFV